jgi:hypothetical protein
MTILTVLAGRKTFCINMCEVWYLSLYFISYIAKSLYQPEEASFILQQKRILQSSFPQDPLLIVYSCLILDLNALYTCIVCVAVRSLIGATSDDSVVIGDTLWVAMKVHIIRRSVFKLGKLSLRTIVVDFFCSSNVGKLDTPAASQAADRIGTS